MALDTGPLGGEGFGADARRGPATLFTHAGLNLPLTDDGEAGHDVAPSVDTIAFAPGVSFGQGLRAAREFLGLSLQDIADATKIRSQYLAALEAMDLHLLPSRPFTLGYVRAYARVLGIDDEQALARFRLDAPDPNEPLRAPVGVAKVSDPRLGFLITGTALVIAAIVVYNVAQRLMAERDPLPTTEVAATNSVASEGAQGPVQLGEPLPAPTESTLPTPYVTPGLPPAAGSAPAAPAAAVQADDPRTFVAMGAVYGAPAAQSQVVLQASRSVSLVARSGDGRVYFAQQLKAGEAYRPPLQTGLLIDVSAPDAMRIYVAGVLAGHLAQAVTPVSALPRPAPAPVVAAAPVSPVQ